MLMNKVVLCVESENPAQATVQELMELILQDDQDLSLPASARDVFSLWLVSPMLGELYAFCQYYFFSYMDFNNNVVIFMCRAAVS